MDINRFASQYWQHIAAQDEQELRKYFLQDACVRWHNTNEQFNVEEFMRANCDYPGSWSGEVERVEHMENKIITVARVWSTTISFHVTSFFEMEDSKIKSLDEYWSEDGSAPQWRLDKHLGQPIR
jgi:hypothetical protein